MGEFRIRNSPAENPGAESQFPGPPAAGDRSRPSGPWTPPAALLEVSEDDDLIPELLGAFMADVSGRLRRMAGAISAGDVSRLRTEAHAMKGGAKQIGADSLASLCLELESAAAQAAPAHLADMLKRLEDAFDDVRLTMEQYLSRPVPWLGSRDEAQPAAGKAV